MYESYDYDEDFSRWCRLPMSEYMAPLPLGPPYFQVERKRLEFLFLQRIGRYEDVKQSAFSKEDVNICIADEVITTLVRYPETRLLDKLRHMSKVAKDSRFYLSVIRAVLHYIHLLYNKECLNRSAHKKEMNCELEMLWQEMSKLGKQGCPPIEVCKLIIRHTVDDKRYRFVTESDLGQLINFYALNLEDPSVFDDPYKDSCDSKYKAPVLRDIKAVLKKTKSFPRLGANEHCHLLITIVRNIHKNIPCLYDEGMKMVDMGALKSLVENFEKSKNENELFCPSEDEITRILDFNFASFTYCAKRELVWQMQQVINPLFNLSDVDSLSVHQHVYEIIEVAELRRHAQGSRFIQRKHLVWAFYERGYGLPPMIVIKLWRRFVSEDHPPYHIYAVAVKLAQCFDGKIMRLEHFVFAILYAKAKDMDFDETRMVEMQEEFKDFMRVVNLDRRKRFAVIDKQVGLKCLLSGTSLPRKRLVGKERLLYSRFWIDYNEIINLKG